MTTSPLRRPWLVLGTLAMILGLFGLAGPTAIAQDTLIPEGAPVGIHSGTCGDMLTEPAYEGGEIELTTAEALAENEAWGVGVFEDPEVGAFGVDLNDDDALTEDEVVGAIGDTDVPVGYAEADFGDTGVDESEPYVVAVHAAPDQYETIIACGSIADAVENDDGERFIPLQPTQDSQLFGYSVLGEDNTTLRTFLFQRGQMPQTPVGTPAIVGYPIEVHEGTCQDWVTEPAYTIGDMVQTAVGAEGEQAAGEMEVEVPAEAEALGQVYKVDVETEFDGNELIEGDTPYIVGVHQDAGDNYGTLIACGQVLEILDDEQIYVFLQPVGTNDMTGFVSLNRDEGEVTGYLWSCQPLEPAAPEATPTPMPTQTPAPTPTEAAVVEATAVVTEVIVETEVVGAATATAIAQEGGANLITVEIGAESPGEVIVAAGEPVTVTNQSDVERVFAIPDLGIEEVIPAGGSVDVTVPADAEVGTYPYQVLENDEPVFEDNFTIDQ